MKIMLQLDIFGGRQVSVPVEHKWVLPSPLNWIKKTEKLQEDNVLTYVEGGEGKEGKAIENVL